MSKMKLPKQFEVTREDQDNSDLIPRCMDSGSLDDWFLHVEGKPRLYFNELLKLCSNIVKSDMTQKYAPSMYSKDGLQFTEKPVELKDHGWSGAKRVNVATGEYIDLGDPLMAIMTGRQEMRTRNTEADQFFMHGKDESCLVEGSWFDWLCLVGNVLSSDTVKHNYPELYQPQLKNGNY